VLAAGNFREDHGPLLQGDSPEQKECKYAEIIWTFSMYRERGDGCSMRKPFFELRAETLRGHFGKQIAWSR
jgi:hypothetical protein